MNQNVDLNGNLDFEHSLFSEIIGFYQIFNAYTDISVSMNLVWLTMIDWPFFHISTLTFYSLLYCLSFGLATFFSLRYGESIVRFFLDKLIQRQPPPPREISWIRGPREIGLTIGFLGSASMFVCLSVKKKLGTHWSCISRE